MMRKEHQQNAHPLVEFLGKGLWKGDLGEMRGDRPRHLKPKKIRQRTSAKKAR